MIVGAQAGVHRNIPDGQHVLGSPAIPVREQRRIFQMIARLPEMHRQLRELTRPAGGAAAGPRARERSPSADCGERRREPDAGRDDPRVKECLGTQSRPAGCGPGRSDRV